ncbi:MAG: hypothetical protein M0036_19235, partial [Desulfobacteraceae bacterium]|nr:hypothetical protein [Desulfobacteraceae bacterium]
MNTTASGTGHLPTVGIQSPVTLTRRSHGLIYRICNCLAGALTCGLLSLLIASAALAANLTIQVKDQDNAPYAGIKVYAYTQAGSYTGRTATTDTGGIAAFGDVSQFSAGNYKFKAVLLGHDFYLENVALPATTQASIVIPKANVTISVRSAGLAAAGVKVYLYTGAGSYLSVNATADSQGQVVFALPVGGVFDFRADVLGTQYWKDNYTVLSGANAVTLDAGGGRLSVTLQKAAGQPMGMVPLYLFNNSGTYLGKQVNTDLSGNGVFDVPSGTYRIRADYLGYQIFSASTPVSANTSLTFEIPHKDITITVNGQEGSPAPIVGAKIYLFTKAGAYVAQSQTADAAGQVRFNLPDQEYRVRADYMTLQIMSDPFRFQDFTFSIPMAEAEVSVVRGNLPLANVPVYLFSASNAFTGTTITTDASGKALFRMPASTTPIATTPAVSWRFRADYQTNQYFTDYLPLPAGVRTPVELSTGGGTLSFNVFLSKNGTEPLPGVNCYVFNAITGAYTGLNSATNSEGKVVFDLPAGRYQIRVDYLGYQFLSGTYEITTAATEVFAIPHQPVQITVNGLFDTPEPIQGVSVYLFNASEQYLSQTVVTDAQGHVQFNLPEKEYKVRVDYLGQQIMSGAFVGQGPNTVVNIPMAEAQVRVTGAGHGLPNATVYVYSASQSYLNVSGTTDADGRVDFRLPAGTYTFRTKYLGHTYESTNNALAAQAAQPIEIATGGGAFTFTLLQGADQPLANTKCYLFNSAQDQYLNMWAITNEQGQLSLELSDGTFTIRADHLGYQFFSSAFQVPQTMSHTFTIPHQAIPVAINGVLDDTPMPLPEVKTYLFSAAESYLGLSQITDSHGIVTYNLPDKEYKVRADYLGYQFMSLAFKSAPATLSIPMVHAQVNVLGIGQPLPGVKVYVFTPSGSYIGMNGVTDTQGAVSFDLPAKSYKFRADYQGSQFMSDALALTVGQPNTVTIDTGGGVFGLRVEKDPANPLAGLPCYVYSGANSYLGLFGTTDAQGRVTFNLANGQYRFKVKYAGYDFMIEGVNVPQTLSQTLTIGHQRRHIFVQGINPGPAPLVGQTVYVFKGDGTYINQSAVTDAEGHVFFDLPANDYKAKVTYKGITYWTDILNPYGNLLRINLGTGSVLPPIQNLAAAINAGNQIVLTWTAPANTNGLTLAGYHVYRRQVCQPGFERITTTPLTAATFTDGNITPTGTYAYYVTAVTDSGVEGYASNVAAVEFGGSLNDDNTTGITNLSASWNQGVATLNWTAVQGCAYQIYRGPAPGSLVPLQRSTSAVFTDTGANRDQPWYYQVATVKTLCDPASGQPIDKIGPFSALVTLAPLQSPGTVTTNLSINGNGDYIIATGAGQGYILEGGYSGYNGQVIVTATLGGQTVTGTASDGHFSITLPTPGNWQIVISEPDGWPSTTLE